MRTRLTEQELKDVLTFYKSPLGKKMLVESQFVMGETIKRADAWAVEISRGGRCENPRGTQEEGA